MVFMTIKEKESILTDGLLHKNGIFSEFSKIYLRALYWW